MDYEGWWWIIRRGNGGRVVDYRERVMDYGGRWWIMKEGSWIMEGVMDYGGRPDGGLYREGGGLWRVGLRGLAS